MPKLDRDVIRRWLEEHNWSVKRLAEECSTLGEDSIPEGTMRNAVNGIDPMSPGRIRLICKVTAKYGDGLTYAKLVSPEPDGQDSSGNISRLEGDMGSEPTNTGRISVNVTPATSAALELLADTEGVSIAEALRLLVGYGALVYDAHLSGNRILIDMGPRGIEIVHLL